MKDGRENRETNMPITVKCRVFPEIGGSQFRNHDKTNRFDCWLIVSGKVWSWSEFSVWFRSGYQCRWSGSTWNSRYLFAKSGSAFKASEYRYGFGSGSGPFSGRRRRIWQILLNNAKFAEMSSVLYNTYLRVHTVHCSLQACFCEPFIHCSLTGSGSDPHPIKRVPVRNSGKIFMFFS
jgi:hypothetical protein